MTDATGDLLDRLTEPQTDDETFESLDERVTAAKELRARAEASADEFLTTVEETSDHSIPQSCTAILISETAHLESATGDVRTLSSGRVNRARTIQTEVVRTLVAVVKSHVESVFGTVENGIDDETKALFEALEPLLSANRTQLLKFGTNLLAGWLIYLSNEGKTQRALDAVPKGVVAEVVGYLDHPHEAVRSHAITVLGYAAIVSETVPMDSRYGQPEFEKEDGGVVNSVLGLMDETNEQVRQQALATLHLYVETEPETVLERAGDDTVVRAVVNRLDDDDSVVREQAIQTLLDLVDWDLNVLLESETNFHVGPSTLELLDDPSDEVRSAAHNVLDSIIRQDPKALLVTDAGTSFVGSLLDLLGDADPSTEQLLINMLALVTNEAPETVFETASRAGGIGAIVDSTTESNPEISNPAFLTLREFVKVDAESVLESGGRQQVLEVVGGRLNASDGLIRKAAIETLWQCTSSDTSGVSQVDVNILEKIVPLLDDGDADIRRFAVATLGHFLVADSDPLAGRLCELGIVESVVGLLDDPDDHIRHLAASLLHDCASETPESILKTEADLDTVDSLVEHLDDPDENVREVTVQTIGRLAGADAEAVLETAGVVDALISQTDHTDEYIKGMTVEAIGHLSGVDAEAVLETAGVVDAHLSQIDHPDAKVRFNAVQTIGRLAGANAETVLETDDIVDALLTCLDDPDEYVRGVTVETIGRLSDANAETVLAAGGVVDVLLTCLDDPDENVTNGAFQTIASLTEADGQTVYDTAPSLVTQSLDALRSEANSHQSEAGRILRSLLRAQPNAVDESAVKSLDDHVHDHLTADALEVREATLRVLFAGARSDPSVVKPYRDALRKVAHTDTLELQTLAVSVLRHVASAPAGHGENILAD